MNKWIEISECPVYRPSKQEFDDPFHYLQNIAPQASKYGICKIVCPISACVEASEVLKELKFETIVQPMRLVNGKMTFFKRARKYSYREFQDMANKAFTRRFSPSFSSPDNLEQQFWREITSGKKGAVEYGVNIEGSAFSSHPDDKFGKSNWNLKNVSGLSKSSLRFLQRSIPGITDPMLYIGMIFSMFAWHVEDHYLYSINYHHSGAPKTWYGVPSDFALRFEKVVLHDVYKCDGLSEDSASKVLAEKTTMFPPTTLLHNDIPVHKAVQMPGEFVITFPRAYHAGFSHGFNCGEAVNFAVGDWFSFGAEATQRYARLRAFPIIPYEQLLCKEATILHQSLKHEKQSHQTRADSASRFSIKLSFVRLVRFYSRALQGPSIARSMPRGPTAYCSLCRRDCYLAYMVCSFCSTSASICLDHGSEGSDCSCGKKRTLFVREDFSAYSDAARTFEQEEQVSAEIDREAKSVEKNGLQMRSSNDQCGHSCNKMENCHAHDHQPFLDRKERSKKGKCDVEKDNEFAAMKIRKRSQLRSRI